jgi:hypothetical protein
MAYDGKVLQVMIACPDDMSKERQIVRDVIYGWNDVHARPNNLIFWPVDWETHLAPDLHGRPQDIINERLLKHCDLLVGLFGSKLGTPTGKAESGSVEEIKRHQAAGKPTMIYFSSMVQSNVDPSHLAALQEFKEWCKSKGIYRPFSNQDDLREQFARHLPQILYDSPYLKAQAQRTPDLIFPPEVIATDPATSLSDEAKELLTEAAADRSNQVLKLQFMSDSYIQTNGKTFGRDAGPRAWARWEFALEQLVDGGLLAHVATTEDACTYKVTKQGYDLADQLN